MPLGDLISIILLGTALGAQVTLRSFLSKILIWIWWVAVAVVFGFFFYLTILQYETWHTGNLSKFFLPPYNGIWYFIFTVGTRILAAPMISFVAAIGVGWVTTYYNRRFKERFFEGEEPRLFALGTFLTGYPGFLFYIPCILLCGAIYAAAYTSITKKRAPLYYLWLPIAIFVILLKHWIVPYEVLKHFIL